jgi:spore maturation protein CgeB
VLADAGLVLVHEWNDHALVAEIGAHRARSGRGYRLFFHDTHHRSVSEPDLMAKYELRHYDGVLTFGRIIRDTYLDNGWAARAWTWHEAADVRVFVPRPHTKREGDLVWIGNWGDEERTAELEEFLIEPVKRLKLRARIYGVRYPPHALQRLADAGIEYGGWLPNYCVPDVFAGYSVTVHVPRRPYVRALPGVPTIRMFEALACGIPLVSAPWDDAEGNFERGRDYLAVRDGEEMTAALDCLLNDQRLARELGEHGRRTILARHTCAHRVDELLNIVRELGPAEAVASHEPLRASAPSGAVGLRP